MVYTHGAMVKNAILLAAAALSALRVGAGEIDAAKNALRDGLTDVARTHASKVEGDDAAKAVILESYARECRWGDLLKTLDSWHDPKGETFDYHRALALAGLGRNADALKALDAAAITDHALAAKAATLRVSALVTSGDAPAALAAAKAANLADGDDEAKMSAAEAFAASGDADAARTLWRKVVASTNAPEAAVASAAVSLGDAEALRSAMDAVRDAAARRSLALLLGRRLIGDEATFGEGADIIRRVVADSPGTPGAQEAYLALADALLERGEREAAADAYKAAMDAWPGAAREFAAHEGLGWALAGLSRHAEAADAFARAEEFAANDTDRAKAVMEQGDALSAAGRGDEAMAKYRLVLEKYPSTPSGERLKRVVALREKEAEGRELYRDFRFREAQAAFEELSRLDPSRKPRMDYLVMLCLYGQMRDAEAARKAKDLAAGSGDAAIRAEAALWLAKFFYNARQWTDAEELFASYATNMAPKSAQAPSALLWAARAAFAGNEFQAAVDFVTRLSRDWPDAPEKAAAALVQGEALVELSRFDEAILVLDGAAEDPKAGLDDRRAAKTLKADALFVMGADTPARYKEALAVYNAVKMGESLGAWERLALSFKIARTLEKMGRVDEAIDQYYVDVVCAYLDMRKRGEKPDDDAKATFARAAFRLADEFEARGEDAKAEGVLALVTAADAGSSAKEARRRIARIHGKGRFQ